MAERLVAEKSRPQRRIEGVMLAVLPPLVGFTLWWRHGAEPLNLLAVLAAFFLVSPLGGLIASFGSGERITPDEWMRRTLERMAEMPFIVVAGWSWITYSSLFLSALFSGCSAEFLPRIFVLVPVLLAITFGCAVLVTYQLRRWHSRYDPAQAAERYRTVGEWLKERLPLQIVCVGAGFAAGFVAAHFVSEPYIGLTLGAGWLAGIALETMVAERILKKKPLLWSQVGFGGALAISMARFGLTFAGFFVLYGLLQPVVGLAEGFAIFFAVTLAISGFVMGTVLMMIFWALARLGDMRKAKT